MWFMKFGYTAFFQWFFLTVKKINIYLKGKNNWSTDSAENTDSGAKPTVYKSQLCHLMELYNLRPGSYIIYKQGS